MKQVTVKKKGRVLIVLMVLAALASLSQVAFAQEEKVEAKPDVAKEVGNDTYNFYFQKAPGPQTVQQGGGNAASAAQAAPIAEMETAATDKPKQKIDLSNWEISAGNSWVQDGGGYDSGFAISVKKNKSKYVGYFGTLNFATKESSNRSARTGLSSVDAHLGIEATPLHMDVFGHTLLEVGGSVGLMTFMEGNYPHARYYSAPNAKKSIGAFWGIKISLNFSDELAVFSDMKTVFENKGQSAVIGARYRF